MKFDSSKPHKLIVATVDENGSEMYYYGYGSLEHFGGHIEPWGSKIEWVEGTVKRSTKYPDFTQGEITSGQSRIESTSDSSLRSGRNHGIRQVE